MRDGFLSEERTVCVQTQRRRCNSQCVADLIARDAFETQRLGPVTIRQVDLQRGRALQEDTGILQEVEVGGDGHDTEEVRQDAVGAFFDGEDRCSRAEVAEADDRDRAGGLDREAEDLGAISLHEVAEGQLDACGQLQQRLVGEAGSFEADRAVDGDEEDPVGLLLAFGWCRTFVQTVNGLECLDRGRAHIARQVGPCAFLEFDIDLADIEAAGQVEAVEAVAQRRRALCAHQLGRTGTRA